MFLQCWLALIIVEQEKRAQNQRNQYRVPTRSGNREKVGNFVIGREVGENVGKNETPFKMLMSRGKVSLLYRGLGLDVFAS